MHPICIGRKEKAVKEKGREREIGKETGMECLFRFVANLHIKSKRLSVFYGSREIKTHLTSVSAFGRFIDTVIYGSSSTFPIPIPIHHHHHHRILLLLSDSTSCIVKN